MELKEIEVIFSAIDQMNKINLNSKIIECSMYERHRHVEVFLMLKRKCKKLNDPRIDTIMHL